MGVLRNIWLQNIWSNCSFLSLVMRCPLVKGLTDSTYSSMVEGRGSKGINF